MNNFHCNVNQTNQSSHLTNEQSAACNKQKPESSKSLSQELLKVIKLSGQNTNPNQGCYLVGEFYEAEDRILLPSCLDFIIVHPKNYTNVEISFPNGTVKKTNTCSGTAYTAIVFKFEKLSNDKKLIRSNNITISYSAESKDLTFDTKRLSICPLTPRNSCLNEKVKSTSLSVFINQFENFEIIPSDILKHLSEGVFVDDKNEINITDYRSHTNAIGNSLFAARLTDIISAKNISFPNISISLTNDLLEMYNDPSNTTFSDKYPFEKKRLSKAQNSLEKIYSLNTVPQKTPKITICDELIEDTFCYYHNINTSGYSAAIVQAFTDNLRMNSCQNKSSPSLEDIWRTGAHTLRNVIAAAISAYIKDSYINKLNLVQAAGKKKPVSETFSPASAKIVINLLRKNHTLTKMFDPCAGWGSRSVAAALSNFDAYVGVDPNKQLQKPYSDMIDFMCNSVTNLKDKRDSFKVLHMGIESLDRSNLGDLCGRFDIAFTSPPFFDLEIYEKDNPEQLTNKYSNYDDWKTNFLTVLVQKVDLAIRDNGVFAIHLGNCTGRGKETQKNGLKKRRIVPIIGDFQQLMRDEFSHFVYLGLMSIDTGIRTKKSLPIFIYQKKDPNRTIDLNSSSIIPPGTREKQSSADKVNNLKSIVNVHGSKSTDFQQLATEPYAINNKAPQKKRTTSQNHKNATLLESKEVPREHLQSIDSNSARNFESNTKKRKRNT